MEMGLLSTTSILAERMVNDLSAIFNIISCSVERIDRDVKFGTEIRQDMVQIVKKSQMTLSLPNLAVFRIVIYTLEILLFCETVSVNTGNSYYQSSRTVQLVSCKFILLPYKKLGEN